jgi:hypothetical protein
MRFFRPEVEAALKMGGVGVLVGLIVLPMAWAYEQRQQARAWQNMACTYRMREVTQRTPLAGTIDFGRDPCSKLQGLGLDLDVQRVNLTRLTVQRVSGR